VLMRMVLVRYLQFQRTATPGTKLLPDKVSSVFPLPWAMVGEELEVSVAAVFWFSNWGVTTGPRNR